MVDNEKITEDDFFRLNKNFSIWLIKKKNKNFHDLSTKKSKKYFKKFAKKWNKKDLNEIYYDQSLLIQKYGHLLNKNHKWQFKVDEKDVEQLQNCLEDVNKFNLFQKNNSNSSQQTENKSQNNSNNINNNDQFQVPQSKSNNINNSRPGKSFQELQLEKEREQEQKMLYSKLERQKNLRKQQEELDDIAPNKLYGKDAARDQKRATNQKLNGKQDNGEFNEMDDSALFGGDSGNSFQKLKSINEFKQQKREEKQNIRNLEMQEKYLQHQEEEDRKIQLILQGGKKFK